MRTELTSPVPDVAIHAGTPLPISRPNSANKLPEDKVQTKAKPVPESPRQSVAPSVVVAVSVDQNQNTIYRFLDQRTGVLIRQVPPEELLRVMRNIDDMLHASQQKLKVDI